jgi:2Fe-2S ferredoxin
MKNQKTIFTINSKKIIAVRGETILEAASKNGVEIDHSCGGNGTCATCRIFVQKGIDLLEPANEIELEMAKDRGFALNERLACQTLVAADVDITLKE